MPLYTFSCECGERFDARAGLEDYSVPCGCGSKAVRDEVYRDQSVVFKGGGFTKSVLPPPGSPDEQDEGFKELRKRGWDGDRAVSEIRKNVYEDGKGRKMLNTAAMTKEA